jgi:hypothetical protein
MRYSASLFCQILSLIPRLDFARLVSATGVERHCRGFQTWDQFVSMLFCQLAHAKSLREISDGLNSSCGKLSHLGLKKAPARSTLSYANSRRDWVFFAKLFFQMRELCRLASPGKKRKFHFRNRLLSLDSSTIDLCLSLFPWAKFRQTKGAVKLHLLLDHDGYFPTFACITDGTVHDVKVAQVLKLPPGSIVVVDRGYTDYSLFYQWTADGVYFVTRMKSNAAYEVLFDVPIPAEQPAVLADQIIRFTGSKAQQDCPFEMRRIVLRDPDTDSEIVFLTNHLDFDAVTVGEIYRDRWEIELFFKVLKQHLKIKTFVGTSPNALRIRIWTALIASLLLKFLQFRSRRSWALSNLVALLRWNLFTYRNLWEWLDDPFQTPPEPPPDQPLLPYLDSILRSPTG